MKRFFNYIKRKIRSIFNMDNVPPGIKDITTTAIQVLKVQCVAVIIVTVITYHTAVWLILLLSVITITYVNSEEEEVCHSLIN